MLQFKSDDILKYVCIGIILFIICQNIERYVPPKKEFDTLKDLKKKLSTNEYIDYIAANYPLMYEQYAKTKTINRILSFIIIGILFVSVVIISSILFYYRNKNKKTQTPTTPKPSQ